MEPGLHTEDSRRQFQYAYGINDGVNPIQETAGVTVLANILNGLDTDEFFTRSDVGAGTTSNLLSDDLGSIVALAGAAGTVETEYTYEPFGRSTATGMSSTNPFQYTGRENDGTGLYFYRARYYHPSLQRFISEDPRNLASATLLKQRDARLTWAVRRLQLEEQQLNLYAYVENNPANLTDPLGEGLRDRIRDRIHKYVRTMPGRMIGKFLGGLFLGGLLNPDPAGDPEGHDMLPPPSPPTKTNPDQPDPDGECSGGFCWPTY